ncbi:MAG: LytTR family DNA-binding domain-containing protein [Bacteroidetes bacterium]|nr:LytTR family DNA-binding domain-containing protein [Bacteroidota bacterium]
MEEVIRTVLVDDDKSSLVILQSLLGKHFTNVNIIGTAMTVKDAIALIDETKPEMVFLDVNLPDGEGFDVIEGVTHRRFQVIFVTAFDKYAVRAFEFSALHYIVKPPTFDGLKTALDRYRDSKVKEEDIDDRISVLRESLKGGQEKIIIPSSDGLNIVKLGDVIRLEADDVYTTFYLSNGQKFVASKSMNNYEKILEDLPFSRIHSKHLINLVYVKRYMKGKGGSVIMEDNSEVEVSVRKKADFLEKLKSFARFV